MESYRIYKSLPLNDFMDMTSFVVAKAGLLITPVIQNMNYNRLNALSSLSEPELKAAFMSKVISFIEKSKVDMENELLITDVSNFYLIVPKTKAVEPGEQLQDKLRELLTMVRECQALSRQTDILADELYDDFWSSLDAIEGDLTTLKSECRI